MSIGNTLASALRRLAKSRSRSAQPIRIAAARAVAEMLEQRQLLSVTAAQMTTPSSPIEGQQIEVDLLASTTSGQGTSWSIVVNGDTQNPISAYAAEGVSTPIELPGQSAGTTSVDAHVIDAGDSGDTGTDVSTLYLSVAEAAISFQPANSFSVNQGDDFTADLGTITDQNPQAGADDFTANVDWSDGEWSGDPTITYDAADSTDTQSVFDVQQDHSFCQAGTVGFSVSVMDTEGQSAYGSTEIYVVPAIDAAAMSGTFYANSGTQFSATLASFTDENPNGQQSDYSAAIDWGDGSGIDTGASIVSDGSGNWWVQGSHYYSTNGVYSASITINDVDGASATVNASVDVSDPPTVANATMSVPDPAWAGQHMQATLYATTTDGSGTDWTVNFNGNQTQTYVPEGQYTSFDLGAVSPGSYQLDAHVTDAANPNDDGTDVSPQYFSVADAAISFQQASPSTVQAGEDVTVDLGTINDQNPQATADDLTVSVSSGDGGQSSDPTIVYDAADSTDTQSVFDVTQEHSFTQAGSDGFCVNVQDAYGQSVYGSSEIDVTPAPPPPPPPIYATGMSDTMYAYPGATFSGTLADFIDTNPSGQPSDYSITVDWNDISAPDANASVVSDGQGGWLVQDSHYFSSTGVYPVSIQINDIDGASATATTNVDVIYQPGVLNATLSIPDHSLDGQDVQATLYATTTTGSGTDWDMDFNGCDTQTYVPEAQYTSFDLGSLSEGYYQIQAHVMDALGSTDPSSPFYDPGVDLGPDTIQVYSGDFSFSTIPVTVTENDATDWINVGTIIDQNPYATADEFSMADQFTGVPMDARFTLDAGQSNSSQSVFDVEMQLDEPTAGSEYYCTVVQDDAGRSSYNTVYDTVNSAAPTELTAVAASDQEIDLSWTDNINSSDVTYNVYRGTLPGFTPSTETQIASGVTGDSYADTSGLSADTRYYYLVTAVENGVESSPSDQADAWTLLPAPTNLTATAVSSSEINLFWTDSDDPAATGIELDRSTDGVNFSPIATLSLDATGYGDTTIDPQTTYVYQVRTLGASGASAPGNTATATSLVAAQLATTSASDSEIDLSWTNPLSDATSIVVQRSTDGVSFTAVATLSPSTTSYADQGLPEQTDFIYQLTFVTSSDSIASDPAYAYSLPAVENLSATAVLDSQIDLYWTSNSPEATGFEIDRSTDGGTTWTLIATVGSTSASYADGGLSPDVDYTYQVRALTANGSSLYTDPADAYTLPDAPTDLSATANGSDEIDLAWADDDPNIDGFDLERLSDDGTYSDIAQVDPGTTTYADTDLLDGTTYNYELFAIGQGGESQAANSTPTTTDYAAPTDLSATAAPGGGVELAWVDNSQTATGTDVERSTDGQNFSQVQAPDGVDGSAAAGTTYYYEVAVSGGYIGAPESAFSNVAEVTTDPGLTLSASGSVQKGDTYTVNAASQHDPSLPDPITGVSIDWGDGDVDEPQSDTDPFTHVYTQPGNYTITATAQGVADLVQATAAVQVSNPQPLIDVEGGGAVNQGSAFTLTANVSGLSSADSVTDWIVDWGDSNVQSLSAGSTLTATHVYAHGTMNYPVLVSAQTTAGVVEGETSATVNAPSPDITSTGPSYPEIYGPNNSYGPGGGAPNGVVGSLSPLDVFICAIATPPASYSIDWGDGAPATTANEVLSQNGEIATYPASHVYTAPGIYYVQAYGGDGSWASTFLIVSLGEMTMAPLPDQAANPAGGPLTVTTTVSGLRSNDVGFATVDWGDGHGPQAASVQFNGTTATITATASSTDALATGDQATITFYDPDEEASQGFGFYQVNLSIAGDGGTSTDSDPVIIPVDDGYDSATQSVPNDELAIPDTADPALVPATITLSGAASSWATWSLKLPQDVLAFVVQDGNLTPLASGLASSPVELQYGDAVVQLELQGTQTVASADLTAMMTPVAADGSPLSPASPPAQAKDKAQVVESPLQVFSVSNNAAGAALGGLQTKPGVIYLPISDVADELEYKLPVDVSGLTVNARLTVPTGWQIYNAINPGLPPMPMASNSVLLDAYVDYQLYVEATNNGGVAPGTGSVQITLTGLPQNKAPVNLGRAAVTPFFLSHTQGSATGGAGPTDVPQYGTYTYTETINGGQWLSADKGTIAISPINPNVMSIAWGEGPNVGDAVYEADAQYVWDMPVNIFEITVTAPINAAVATGGTPKGTSVGTYVSATVTTLTMNAAFTITGPSGTHGLSDISVGFIQNASPVTTQATYRTDPTKPATAKSYALASHTFNNQTLDGNTFWDTQGYNATNKLYNTEAKVKGSAAGTIWTVDAPQVVFPHSSGNGNIFSDTAVWNMTMYVVGFTDEAAATFVPQASLGWTFNGSSTFPNNKWQTNGGGVTYRTPAGQTLPLAQAVWTATGGPVAAFTTQAPQFNYLIQSDPKLNPQLQIPPVYLAPIT